MKIILIQGIRNLPFCSIGKRDLLGRAAQTGRHGPLLRIRWIDSPVPVWQPKFLSGLGVCLLRLSVWKFASDLDSPLMEHLLKGCKVRSMPSCKQICLMGTVALLSTPFRTIPFCVRRAMDTCRISIQPFLWHHMTYQPAGNKTFSHSDSSLKILTWLGGKDSTSPVSFPAPVAPTGDKHRCLEFQQCSSRYRFHFRERCS
jgi:hypothetical protein